MQGRSALLVLTVILLFLLIVVGAFVASVPGFPEACGTNIPSDWPGCLNGLLPPLQLGPVAEYTHRILAALSTLFLFLTTYAFWRGKREPSPTRLLLSASVLIVFQVFLGGAVVALLNPELLSPVGQGALVALHQAVAILVFGLAVAALVSRRRPANGFNARPN